MNTLFRRIIRVGLAAILISTAAMAGPLKVGDPMPDLAKFKLEGTLPALNGQVVLVDFWASWCLPCKRSFPVMKELHEKFSGRGLLIVAISVDEEKKAMDAFLKKLEAPFVVVRDPTGKTPEAFGAETMPTSFVIGADGRITAVHNGFEDATRKEYLTQIEAALKAAGK